MTKNHSLYMQKLIIFIAIELIFSFSALGFITISPISITLIPLIVMAGAFVLGPVGGTILGGVFGLVSMWKASVSATDYADIIFSPFVSGEPLYSLILCLGTRMLFGFISGILFSLSKKCVHYKKVSIILSAIISDIFHSTLVLLCIHIFFPKAGILCNYIILRIISLQNIIEYILIIIFVIILYKASNLKKAKKFFNELKNINTITKSKYSLATYITLVALMSFILAILSSHFYTRIETIIYSNNIIIHESVINKFLNIGLQFLLTIISLFIICIVCFIVMEKYFIELSYRANRDMMTGLYNKNSFSKNIEASLSHARTTGYLLIFDIDDFKKINDTYGHPQGDRVISSIAELLTGHFNSFGIIGRLGGDEFSVFVENVSKEEVINMVEEVKHNMTRLTLEGEQPISCSIGITSCTNKNTFDEAYLAADKALYAAKKQGKNCCVIME